MLAITKIELLNYTTADEWREYVKGKTSLDLQNMNLTDQHIIALAEILKENPPIRSINLDNNKITKVGANALADALRLNHYLAANPLADTHALKFEGNNIGKEGMFAIIKSFDETGRFAHCMILAGDENITEEEAKELSETPELIHIVKRTEKFRYSLYPSGNCTLS